MRLLHVFILVGISLCAAPLLRAEPGMTVPKEDFIAGMQNALPTALCTDQSYFRNCFRVSPKECEATALSATRVCIENLKDKMPAELKQPEGGQQWGKEIGMCVGKTYVVTLASKMIESKKCSNPAAW